MANDMAVRSVERALSILNCYTLGKSSFTLVELARLVELSPSTTLRLLTTLEKQNYIFRDPATMRYYLGFKLAQISHLAFENLDFCRLSHPFLQQLNLRFNESVGLCMVKQEQRVCVDRIEGTQQLRSVMSIGMNAPLTRGAAGKMLLAHQPAEVIERIIAKSPDIEMGELKKIREQGYAISYGEREPGLASVAAPLFDSGNNVVAAIFLSAPEARVCEQQISEFRDAVIESAKSISRQLGYSQV